MTEERNAPGADNLRTAVETRPVDQMPPPGATQTDQARPAAVPANQWRNQEYGAPYYGYGMGYGYAPGYAYAPLTANHEQITLASGANLLLGLWLIAAPFVLSYGAAHARANDIVLGIIIATLAAIRVFGAYRSAWISWVNMLAGLWLIIAPFALGYSGIMHPLWNDIIVGILVAGFALWSALATHGVLNSGRRFNANTPYGGGLYGQPYGQPYGAAPGEQGNYGRDTYRG